MKDEARLYEYIDREYNKRQVRYYGQISVYKY